MKPLSDKVWEFWEGPTGDRHLRWIPEEYVKQKIKRAYLDMPWAILSPLGKKAIEVAFKDNFGFDLDAVVLLDETGEKDGSWEK